MNTSLKPFLRGIAMIGLTVLLTACMDDLFNSSFSVESIQNNKRYVGLHGEPAPNPAGTTTMPEQLVISYDSFTANADVYLNGQQIGHLFSYGSNQATLDVARVSSFLRQGRNLLLVDPLGFGPQVTFTFDNAGPMIDVLDVNCLDGDCAQVNDGDVELTVRAQDTTSVSEVLLVTHDYQWNGITDGGWNPRGIPFNIESVNGLPLYQTSTVRENDQIPNWTAFSAGTVYPLSKNKDGSWSGTVPEATLYELRAVDSYGYETRDFYLSANEKINNVFKLKINKDLLDNLVPIAAPLIEGMHIYAPQSMKQYNKSHPNDPEAVSSDLLDTMSRFWRQDAIFYNEVGASTTNRDDCGYIDTNTYSGASDGVVFNCTNQDGSHCRDGNWVIPSDVSHKSGRCSRIVLWRLELDGVDVLQFSLDPNNQSVLRLDMQLVRRDKGRALYTDMGIRHVRCGRQTYCTNTDWLGRCTNTAFHTDAYCRDDGGASYLGVGLGDLRVRANSGNPRGGVLVDIHNGNLDLETRNLRLNLSGLSIGSALDIFIGALAGILDGLFVSIVESVLQENMQDFILGADLFLETDQQDPPDPSLVMQSEAYQVYTNADGNAATETEWFMQYAGFFKALKQHPEVAPVLGSRFVPEGVRAPLDSPSVLDVSLNVNIINQALMSLYRSGVTHITVTNLKYDKEPLVHFGPSVSDAFDTVANGDQRVALVPATPGMFEMGNAVDGSSATLYYRNAQMNIETYRNGAWERDFEVNVDIRAGVYMTAKDGKFQMTILGSPDLQINSIKAQGAASFLPDNVLRNLIQFGIDLVMNVAVPQIADTFAEIDYPPIAGPEGTELENFEFLLKTDKIEANNNRHLNFALSLEVEEN